MNKLFPSKKPELLVKAERTLISHGDICKRGWRVGSIARLLGAKGDKRDPTVHISRGKFYYLDRVIAMEGTAPWLAEKAAEAAATAKARRPMASVAGLRARGWTRSMVEALLGEPDRFGANMHGGAPTRLYFLDRVEALEATDAFARAQDAAAARIAVAVKAGVGRGPRLPEPPRDRERELRVKEIARDKNYNFIRCRDRDPQSTGYGLYAITFFNLLLIKQNDKYFLINQTALDAALALPERSRAQMEALRQIFPRFSIFETWLSLDEIEHWLSCETDGFCHYKETNMAGSQDC